MKTEKRAELKVLWEQRLKDWKASGLSQINWCRQHNLNSLLEVETATEQKAG